MNANNRRIFIRAAARKGVTAKVRHHGCAVVAWSPMLNGRQVIADNIGGPKPIDFCGRMAALRYAINHAEQS